MGLLMYEYTNGDEKAGIWPDMGKICTGAGKPVKRVMLWNTAIRQP